MSIRNRPRVWLAVFFFTMVLTGQAAAQSEEVQWSASAEYAFGQSMTFGLTAESPAIIDQATLFVSAPELPNTLSVVVGVSPSRQIEVTYELDLAQVQLAPFTRVTYWWRLQSGGDEITLAQQSLIYEDDQFEWHTVEQAGTAVHWTGDDVRIGQLGLDIVTGAWPRLTPSSSPAGKRWKIFMAI